MKRQYPFSKITLLKKGTWILYYARLINQSFSNSTRRPMLFICGKNGWQSTGKIAPCLLGSCAQLLSDTFTRRPDVRPFSSCWAAEGIGRIFEVGPIFPCVHDYHRCAARVSHWNSTLSGELHIINPIGKVRLDPKNAVMENNRPWVQI